jgi:carbon storage regulator CsrA
VILTALFRPHRTGLQEEGDRLISRRDSQDEIRFAATGGPRGAQSKESKKLVSAVVEKSCTLSQRVLAAAAWLAVSPLQQLPAETDRRTLHPRRGGGRSECTSELSQGSGRKVSNMLVLSRKIGEKVVIGDGIVVVVKRIHGQRVTFGIDAPESVRIVRGELPRFEDLERPAPARHRVPDELWPVQPR